jgi:hypothetical protein
MCYLIGYLGYNPVEDALHDKYGEIRLVVDASVGGKGHMHELYCHEGIVISSQHVWQCKPSSWTPGLRIMAGCDGLDCRFPCTCTKASHQTRNGMGLVETPQFHFNSAPEGLQTPHKQG